MKTTAAERKWRNRQPKGAIMKPETFQRIKADAMRRGLSEERAEKEAGRAYWNAERKRFRESQKHSRGKKR